METRIAIITGTRSSFGKLTAKTLVSKGINVHIRWYSLVLVGIRWYSLVIEIAQIKYRSSKRIK